MRITIEERICPNCGESSEKEYETVFFTVKNYVFVAIRI